MIQRHLPLPCPQWQLLRQAHDAPVVRRRHIYCQHDAVWAHCSTVGATPAWVLIHQGHYSAAHTVPLLRTFLFHAAQAVYLRLRFQWQCRHCTSDGHISIQRKSLFRPALLPRLLSRGFGAIRRAILASLPPTTRYAALCQAPLLVG